MSRRINDILKGKIIGISISDSEDIARLGYGDSHLQDAKVEIARHLLSCGCTLMYGGDLRPGGFTNTLFDLVEAYSSSVPNIEVKPKLINYLGWPLDSTLTEKQQASLSEKIKLIMPGLPLDIKGQLRPKQYLVPDTPKKYYVWARSMTFMREAMNEECNARIVLGGRMNGFKGKYPGIIEEVCLSIKSKVPTYIIGTFGGASGEIINSINGNSNHRIGETFLSKDAKENMAYFNSNKPQDESEIDYEGISTFFKDSGISGLNNELTNEENETLFKTPHIPEMVSLVIKGLVKKFNT